MGLRLKNLVAGWLLPILWAGLIFLGSSLPGAAISNNFWINWLAHKIVHLFEYSVLAILWSRRYSPLAVFVMCLIYAMSDEEHQSLVAGRVSTGGDVLIDGLGILLGLFFWWRFRDWFLAWYRRFGLN